MLKRSAQQYGIPAPVQQRLFTGGLFFPHINESLHRFAQSYALSSNVWVPQKAFDELLKPFGVFILPSAALCDVAMGSAWGFTGSESACSPDRVLVNASQTSSTEFFERFRELMVASPEVQRQALSSWGLTWHTTLLSSKSPSFVTRSFTPLGSATESPQGYLYGSLITSKNTQTCEDGVGSPEAMNAAVYCPTNEGGRPWLLHKEQLNVLFMDATQKGFRSNYWPKSTPTTGACRNAEETPFPGRYNTSVSISYEPVSLVGRGFPCGIGELMRHRAVRYGYVSRVWVTAREARALYRVEIRRERAADWPPVYYGEASTCPVAFFCADQFEDSAMLFPTEREIHMAEKGVSLPVDKLRGFPLLHRLSVEGSTGQGARTAPPPALLPQTTPSATRAADTAGDRGGADTAMRDASRLMRFLEATSAYASIRLFGFRTRADERLHLRGTLAKQLRRECVLRGFPTPHFIGARHVFQYGLALRPGEIGVSVHSSPVQLWRGVWTDGEVWYNIAQLANPLVGLTLFYHHPQHFLTRRRLSRSTCVECCQVQLAAAYRSCQWIPLCVAWDAGWKLKDGARAVSCKEAYDTNLKRRLNLHFSSALCNMDEVLLPAGTRQWLRSYRPVDPCERPYLRDLRMLMALRACERGYTSPVWVPIFPHSDYRCSTHPTPVKTDTTTRLTGAAFSTEPLVSYRSVLYANIAEIANAEECLAHDRRNVHYDTPKRAAQESRGEGYSAEMFCIASRYNSLSEPKGVVPLSGQVSGSSADISEDALDVLGVDD